MTLVPSRLSDPDADTDAAFDDSVWGAAARGGGGGGGGASFTGSHPLLGGAAEIPRTLVWEAYLGNATAGNGTLMEDDASTNAYKQDDLAGGYGTRPGGARSGAGAGSIATTTAAFTVAAGGQALKFSIGAVQGGYQGMAAQRNYEVRLRGSWAPTGVVVTTLTADQRRTVVPVASV